MPDFDAVFRRFLFLIEIRGFARFQKLILGLTKIDEKADLSVCMYQQKTIILKIVPGKDERVRTG